LTFTANQKTKRKRAKGVEAQWRHAGQVFCEMLGQVCHPEIYATSPAEFVEVILPSVLTNK